MKSRRATREENAQILKTFRAAMKLDTPGMPVMVTWADGQVEYTTLAALPETDAKTKLWVAKVGGGVEVDCTRIEPVRSAGSKERRAA